METQLTDFSHGKGSCRVRKPSREPGLEEGTQAFSSFFFETGPWYVAQIGLQCWNYKHEGPCPALSLLLLTDDHYH